MSRNTQITMSNLTKNFGRVKALNDFTINIESGIFGLVGPNGAGKTTILRILLGLIRPDKGSACVLGINVSKGSEKYLNQVGVLHENPYYPPSLTPTEYLNTIASLYRKSRSTEELLSLVDLSDAANRKIKNLSAGMYRRLGIAQTLVGRPRLVFLDEPTSNLDVRGRDLIVQLIIKTHQEEGVSFFLTSHILSELERACHEIGFINEGRLIDKGQLKELVEKHTQNRFRIISSDATKLKGILEKETEIVKLLIEGSATLIIEVSTSFAKNIDTRLRELVVDSDINLYEIRNTGTLEDAFRKVMDFE